MKKIFIYLLCFLIIVFLAIFFYFWSSKVKESRIENIIKQYELEDEYEDKILGDEENPVDYYKTNTIFYEENNLTEYNKKQLDKIVLNIKDIPDEVLNYIPVIDDVYNNIKEYVYFNGLIDSEEAVYMKHQISESTNQVALLFKLNNDVETELVVVINKKNNQIEVSER